MASAICEKITFGTAPRSAMVPATLILKFHYKQILVLFNGSKKNV
jgi:hypothetical protein